MVIRDTVLLGDPRLRDICEEVDFDDPLNDIMKDLKDTLTEHQRLYGMGRGIAAPQIGYSKRIVYIQSPKFTGYLFNPEITWKSKEMFDVWDSCFSLKAEFFVNIPRHRSVKVKYDDASQVLHEETFIDDMSELLQHEIDHLDGVMCSDRLMDPKKIVMREEWEKRYRTPGIGM